MCGFRNTPVAEGLKRFPTPPCSRGSPRVVKRADWRMSYTMGEMETQQRDGWRPSTSPAVGWHLQYLLSAFCGSLRTYSPVAKTLGSNQFPRECLSAGASWKTHHWPLHHQGIWGSLEPRQEVCSAGQAALHCAHASIASGRAGSQWQCWA